MPACSSARPGSPPRASISISLSRRISNGDGSFARRGRRQHAAQLLSQPVPEAELRRRRRHGVFDTDGTILMRTPFEIERIGQSIKSSQTFRLLPRQQSGSLHDEIDRRSRQPALASSSRSATTSPWSSPRASRSTASGVDWWQQLWLTGIVVAALWRLLDRR